MIALDSLNQTYVGRWVEYRDRFDGRPERGRIKSWNTKFIFVVYRCNDDWDRFEFFTGVATDPTDLSFV
jgi:hypothetical protein